MSDLRSKTIRLAASMPKGSAERKALLEVLHMAAAMWYKTTDGIFEWNPPGVTYSFQYDRGGQLGLLEYQSALGDDDDDGVLAENVSFEKAKELALVHSRKERVEKQQEERQERTFIEELRGGVRTYRNENGPYADDFDYARLHYNRWLALAVQEGFLTESLRRKLNRHNKQIGGLSSKKEGEASDVELMARGLEMILAAHKG